jgi:drug/metabolite transporter (DMT)-like permease
VTALMALLAWMTRARWPRTLTEVGHVAVSAWLVHGAYLGGVFVALSDDMPAGTIAMLVGLQPLLTVLLARRWLGERIVARQWAGLLLGLVGVWLVVRHRFGTVGSLHDLWPAAVALAGISVGALYQKRFCTHVDLRAGAVIQFGACALVFAPLVAVFEPAPVRWTGEFAFALAWSVLVLSVGAISLLYWLLRHGEASNVARLFYLVPPTTAVLAWLVFGESLGAAALAGMVLIALGVALARPVAAR